MAFYPVEDSAHNIAFYKQQGEIGRLVLCEARNNDDTRVFIRRFSSEDIQNKAGWWDMFTISKSKFKKGFHFCTITDFRVDKNNYINMIVGPYHYLGENINLHSYAWSAMNHKKLNTATLEWKERFSKMFCDIQFAAPPFLTHRNNITNIYDAFQTAANEIIVYDEYSIRMDVCQYLFEEFVLGNITIEEIESILDAPTSEERFLEDIHQKLISKDQELYSKYPRFATKYMNSGRPLKEFLLDQCTSYARIFGYDIENTLTDLEKTEAVLRYREEQKQAKKIARKQERQETKAAKSVE